MKSKNLHVLLERRLWCSRHHELSGACFHGTVRRVSTVPPPAYASGADAVFSPSVDQTERRTRLWALLRTRALFRSLDRKQRRQGSELGERRRWVSYLLHDLQGPFGALRANVEFLSQFAPAPR